MKTVIVWYLVTVGGYYNNTVTYSPPLEDAKACKFLQENMPRREIVNSRCIELRVVK